MIYFLYMDVITHLFEKCLCFGLLLFMDEVCSKVVCE